MTKKIINIIAFTIWVLASGLWIVSMIVPNLEITKETIRNICLICTISSLLYGLVYILPIKKPKNLGGIISVVSVLLLGIIEMTDWKSDWIGDWETQTILYKHGHFKNKTIEFQMQDKGSLGYNRRIVKVTRITGFLDYVSPIDISKISLPWIKVNIHVNELGLKGG